jgi:hypothetical protein
LLMTSLFNKIARVALVLIASTGLAGPAIAASTIYGSAYSHPGGAATLYSISPTTGVATPIGPIGFFGVGALDFAPNGTLYGIGLDSSNNEVLLTVNPMTGAGTLVGPLGTSTGTHIADMAFRSDGALFAHDGGSNFYSINTTTGGATVLGSDRTGYGDGMAFSAGGTLYIATDSPKNNLYTVDPSNGAETFSTALTFPAGNTGGTDPRVNGMKFDLATGTLFASVVNGDGATASN